MQAPQSKETLKLEIIHAVTRMDDLQLLETLYGIIQLGQEQAFPGAQISSSGTEKKSVSLDPDAVKQLQQAIDDLFFVD